MSAGKLTVITATQPATLGKTFSLDAGGALQKRTAAQMLEGSFEVVEFDGVAALASILAGVGTDHAITASLPVNGARSGRIVTRNKLRENPGALARTKEHFGFVSGQPGVMILDYDPPGGSVVRSCKDLWGLMLDTVPEVAQAGVIWWCSGSSHILNGDIELQGLRGQRLYILVTDLADVPRAAGVLSQRLWLAGLGRIEVSASGQTLLRDIFDGAMPQPARLDFCGGAVCESPLEQRRGAPVVLSDGGWLDTAAVLPDLDAKTLARYEGMVSDAKEKAEPAARTQREVWKAARVNDETARHMQGGMSHTDASERAERTLSSALSGVLLGDFSITLSDGRPVSVGAVLDDRERFHGALCFDPLEPEYQGGKVTGKLYLFGAQPTLHSFAHGGRTYSLRRQPARIYVASGRKAEVADELRQRLADEPDIFLRGGVLVRYTDGRLLPIKRAAGLAYEVGRRYALFRKSDKGVDMAVDLDDATANMILASIGA